MLIEITSTGCFPFKRDERKQCSYQCGEKSSDQMAEKKAKV